MCVCVCVCGECLCVFVHISSSSSSCHAASMDLADTLLPSVSIIHCSRELFKAIFYISTELLYVGSSWSSCFCSSMWRGPPKYVAYEFILTSPAVSHVSGSPNLDSFRGRWPYNCRVCGMLPPGLQYCLQHFCVIAVKLFLQTFS